ncbi:hypothetical protein B7P43_G17982 [Cryptotermes secundus]|uniref:Thioredoxin domain-containing protein n=1 Tax=Cryptotermes secundus TaxID=105785 RepID=A0A2J7PNM7_9NEOP|nr:hypothetical protein B7P43_G17982 [Cryptotermes secundus]
MTVRVLGVGIGLFAILAIWTVAIISCIIFHRTHKKFGTGVVAVASVVTVILILIPRDSELPKKPVNEDFVNKVMNSDVPVIVNFHAEWCDPCKILSPKLKELVDPMNDVHLAIIDVENNAELVHAFDVKAVPAVLAVRSGLVVDKFIGLVDADMIENLIKKLTMKQGG